MHYASHVAATTSLLTLSHVAWSFAPPFSFWLHRPDINGGGESGGSSVDKNNMEQNELPVHSKFVLGLNLWWIFLDERNLKPRRF